MTVQPDRVHSGACTLTMSDGSTLQVAHNLSEVIRKLSSIGVSPGNRLVAFDVLNATGMAQTSIVDITKVTSWVAA